jgi:hypothetical protein
MSILFLAVLAPIVSLAADGDSTDRLAAADNMGHVFVSEDAGGTWQPIFECADSDRETDSNSDCPEQRPALAWADGSLFIACPNEPIVRLDRDQLSPLSPSSSVLVARRPTALAGGQDLLLGESDGALWRLRSDSDLVERRRDPPIAAVAIAVLDDRVIVGGPRSMYEWRSGHWSAVRESSSCSLAAVGNTLWSAGPEGIARIEDGIFETVNSQQAIAIAASARWLWWSDGQVFERVPLTAGDRPTTLLPDITRWPQSDRRARTSAWLPQVELAVRVGKQWSAGANGSIPSLDRQTQLWFVLSWDLDSTIASPHERGTSE